MIHPCVICKWPPMHWQSWAKSDTWFLLDRPCWNSQAISCQDFCHQTRFLLGGLLGDQQVCHIFCIFDIFNILCIFDMLCIFDIIHISRRVMFSNANQPLHVIECMLLTLGSLLHSSRLWCENSMNVWKFSWTRKDLLHLNWRSNSKTYLRQRLGWIIKDEYFAYFYIFVLFYIFWIQCIFGIFCIFDIFSAYYVY